MHAMAYAEAAKSTPPSKPSQSFSPLQPVDLQPHDDERPIWIYVDDSNIWISAKKLAASAKRLKTKEDHRVRIEIGRLTSVVARNRPVAQGFLYGSEPPPVDTVWEKIKDHGWEVDCKKRSRMTGKEKGVDAQLVADITERAIVTSQEERTTIVIISGDADAKPAVDKVLKYKGWNVEVCMWKDAMSTELKQLPQVKEGVKVYFLDEFLDKITFTSMKFDIKHHPYLLSFVKASGVVFQMDPASFRNRVPTVKWCKQLESITQWPFQYYWIEENGQPTNNLVLVFKPDITAGEFDIAGFLNIIKEYPIQYVKGVQTYLQYEQARSGLLSMALETYGHLSYDDACSGHEDEASFVSEEEAKDWEVKRRSHPPSRSQCYSQRCPFKFNCTFGHKCYYKHSKEEREFFCTNQGVGNPLRKVKPCSFYPRCKKECIDCHYAHGEEDAWCLNCRTQGHFTVNCPQR